MTELVSGQVAEDVKTSLGRCPGCGDYRPHQHDGWAWGMPVQAEPQQPIRAVIIRVTPAQRRVLVELTRDGATNLVIARRLSVQPQTIKTHLKSVMSQLPLVTTRTELAVGLIRGTIKTTTVKHGEGRWGNRGAFRPS